MNENKRKKYVEHYVSLGPNNGQSFIITQQEEQALEYIDPLLFTSRYFAGSYNTSFSKKEIRRYCINEMQHAFRNIFRKFIKLSGNVFWESSQVDISRFGIMRNIVKEHIYDASACTIDREQVSSEELVLSYYRELQTLLEQEYGKIERRDITLENNFIPHKTHKYGWQYAVFTNFQDYIRKNLSAFVSHSILHGSFGSKDFLPCWSDADILVFLNKNVFGDITSLLYARTHLKKISSLCYKIDPLAHHELIFFTDCDMQYYPNVFFPTALFSKGLLLFGDGVMGVSEREDVYERFHFLYKKALKFRRKTTGNRYAANRYIWKGDLADMMILPSLLLQIKDIYVYKKESFKKVKIKYPDCSFEVIDRASSERKQWRQVNILRYIPTMFFTRGPSVLTYYVVRLHNKLFRVSTAEGREQENIKEITNQFSMLIDNALEHVLNNK